MTFIKDTQMKKCGVSVNRQFAIFYCPRCKKQVEKQKRLGLNAKTCGCKINYTGEVINGFEIISDYGGYRRSVLAICPICNNSKKILFASIKNNIIKSCGCTLGSSTKHGLSYSSLYSRWSSMKQRCYNKKHKRYSDWGGRGIFVCDEWINNFIAFKDWAMENGYKENLSIDRKNNDGGYTPGNCRWVNSYIQTRNTRPLQKNNKSGFRGVSWDNERRVFVAKITVNNKSITLGINSKASECYDLYKDYVIDNGLEHNLL